MVRRFGFLFLFLAAALFAVGCDTQEEEDPGEVVIEDLTVGEGAEAALGDSITVLVTGKLTSGKTFWATGTTPATFRLDGGLIAGWQIGIPGMKVGGKRRLTIPPAYGYGPYPRYDNNGQLLIPANSTLIFDVELVALKKN